MRLKGGERVPAQKGRKKEGRAVLPPGGETQDGKKRRGGPFAEKKRGVPTVPVPGGTGTSKGQKGKRRGSLLHGEKKEKEGNAVPVSLPLEGGSPEEVKGEREK